MVEGDSLFGPLTPLNLGNHTDHPFRQDSSPPRSPLKSRSFCPRTISSPENEDKKVQEPLRWKMSSTSATGKVETGATDTAKKWQNHKLLIDEDDCEPAAIVEQSFMSSKNIVEAVGIAQPGDTDLLSEIDGPDDFTLNLMKYFTAANILSKFDDKSSFPVIKEAGSEKQSPLPQKVLDAELLAGVSPESDEEVELPTEDLGYWQRHASDSGPLIVDKQQAMYSDQEDPEQSLLATQKQLDVQRAELGFFAQKLDEKDLESLKQQERNRILEHQLSIQRQVSSGKGQELLAKEQQLEGKERQYVDETETLKQQLGVLEQELCDNKQLLATSHNENASLKESVAFREEQIEDHKPELSVLKFELEATKEKVVTQEHKIYQKESEITQLGRRLNEAEQQLSEMESLKMDLDQQKNLTDLQKLTISQYESENELLQVRLENCDLQLKEVHQTFTDISEIQSMRAVIENMSQQLNVQKLTLSEKDTEIETLKVALEQHRMQIHGLKVAGLDYEARIEKQRAESEQNKKSLTLLKELRSKNDRLKEVLAQHQKDVQSQKIEESSKDASLEILRTEVEQMKKRIRTQKITIDKTRVIEQALKKHKSRMDFQKSLEAEIRSQLTEYQERLHSHTLEASDREAELRQQRVQILEYKLAMEKVSEIYRRQRVEIEDLRMQLEDEKQEKEKRGTILLTYIAKEDGGVPGKDGRIPYKPKRVR